MIDDADAYKIAFNGEGNEERYNIYEIGLRWPDYTGLRYRNSMTLEEAQEKYDWLTTDEYWKDRAQYALVKIEIHFQIVKPDDFPAGADH